VSNLIPTPGYNPNLQSSEVQAVQVRDLGPAGDDEIDLRELWRALKRRKKIVGVTAAGVLALTALITAYQRLFTPVYQGSFSLLISDPIDNEHGQGAGAALATGGVFEQLARNSTSNDIPTLIEVLQSPLLLKPIAERFDLTTKALAGRISIATGGEKRKEAEGVLNVSLTGRQPKEDQRLLIAISEAYLQAALQQRQQRLNDGLSFLNKQAPALQERTAKLQSELAQFRERNNLLEPTAEGAALKERTAQLEAQGLALQAERSRLLKVRSAIAQGRISARGFQEAISTSSTGGVGQQGLAISDRDQSLLQQMQTLEGELAAARGTYRANSSRVRSLEARLAQLQPLLRTNQLEAVDAALALNAGRLATAQSQQNALNDRFLKQPALIKQYETLQDKLKIAQQNLAGLVSARETFQLELAQRSVPWRVIAPPTINPSPIKPSVPRNLALGTVLGLVAGAGAGLLRDRLDHVFHHPGEVKDELGLPLLGHIPHVEFFKGVREDKRFLLQELDQSVSTGGDQQARYQRFFYQEAFRNLYTSLRFLNSDRPLKSVALTSSLPAEGKSLVNVLLAKTLSEMGQRVLLIDADLRKPQMHHRLGMNNLTGLSNVLTDDGQRWQDAVQRVPGYENWSVITAGRRPPDPTRLLSSQRMHQLVGELTSSGHYDLVVFDTPPALGLADAALVAEHCDGLMLLVSLSRVDRGLPREAVQRIRSSGAPLLGVITNAIKEENQGGAAYGYGYGKYGYGYGYGGYGYAAYDTSAAYSYYAEEDAPKPKQPVTLNPAAADDLQARFKRWTVTAEERRRQFMRWLDS